MKWVGRVIYLAVVVLVTVMMVFYSIGSKYTEYYKKNQDAINDDDLLFLTYTLEANYTQYEVFIKRVPLYHYKGYHLDEDKEVDARISFSILATSFVPRSTKDQNRFDLLLFVFEDVIVNSGTKEKPSLNSSPMLQLGIEFDKPVAVKKDNEVVYEKSIKISGTQMTNRSNMRLYWIIDEALMIRDDNNSVIDHAEIIGFNISYPLNSSESSGGTYETLLSLAKERDAIMQDQLFTGDNVFDLNNRILDLRYEKYNISSQVDRLPSESDSNLYYHYIDFGAYNYIIVRNMIIYGVIVLAITYFLYFNKFVIELIHEKKYLKDRASKDNAIEAETVSKKEVESIFKDHDETKTNKKK